MDHKSPKDSPDSTVNIDTVAPPRVPPLTLIGERLVSPGSSGSSGRSIISRYAYNASSNSYSHVPSSASLGDAGKIVINLPKRKVGSGENLSYSIKEMEPSASSSISSSPAVTKSPYGSQSRVRNFLRPSIMSKQPGRVYTSPNSKDAVGGMGDPADSRSGPNSSPVSSTYVTSRPPNQNQALKLHIRREVASNANNAAENLSGSASTSFVPVKPSSYSILPRNVCDSSISSSIGDIQISPISMTSPVSTSRMASKALNSPVIQQLHPSLLKQLKKQAQERVVDINIDEGRNIRQNMENSRSSDVKGKIEKVSNSNNAGLERRRGVNANTVNSNTITITIGDEGVISEIEQNNCLADSNDETPGRSKRKRKPTKQFTPESAIPRLKIRRKKDADEAEGTPTSNFSLVAIEEGDNAVTESGIEVEEQGESPVEIEVVKKPGRGRPRGSVNRPKVETPPKPKPMVAGRGRGRGRPRGSGTRNKAEPSRKVEEVENTHEEAVVEEKPEVVSESEPEEEKDVEPITPALDPTSIASVATVVVTQKDVNLKTETSSEVESTPSPRKTRNQTPRKARANGARRRTTTPRRAKGRKKPEPKPKQSKVQLPPPVQVFEEETRMSADIKPPTLIAPSPAATPVQSVDEESVGASNISSTSTSVTGTSKTKKFTKDLVPDRKPVTAETLFEYCWPQTERNDGDMYMLQEQVSEYLGVKSFKRKYPDVARRSVDMEERDFVRSMRIVSETECDLGLTALCSSDVLDIMFNDFPDKFEEFNKVLQERKEKELAKLKGAPIVNTPPVRDRSKEFYRRCLKSTAKWNSQLNRQRKDERVCSFDLQTFTLHYPEGKMKRLPPEATKLGHYPTTVLPGQYSDHYKMYSPNELKYLPLNTVLYGPVLPSQKLPPIEAESDEDIDSSSSSSSSSSDDSDSSDEETVNQNGMHMETDALPDSSMKSETADVVRKCKTCDGSNQKNKQGQPEPLLHCTKCDTPNHPTCLELRIDMLPFIKKYNWQCTDCKNCIECNDPADEDKMLFCDLCDRGYHIYCVGLRKVPTGRWHCRVCSVCFSCGTTQPSQDDRLAEWHHEFRKGEKNTRHFTHSLCISCHKLYKKGQFCPSCLKVHLKHDDSSGLVECRSCEKWVHKDCITRPLQSMFGFMCDPCDSAFRTKTKLPTHAN